MIAIIAAMDHQRVIGKNNKLPWKLPAEMAHFKQVTTGNTVLMGRHTFESIGRPLPNRHNVIVSSQELAIKGDNVEVISDVHAFLKNAQQSEELIFVIGGAKLYQTALAYADLLILSLIPGHYEGDTFFPVISDSEFTLDHRAIKEGFEVLYYRRKSQ